MEQEMTPKERAEAKAVQEAERRAKKEAAEKAKKEAEQRILIKLITRKKLSFPFRFLDNNQERKPWKRLTVCHLWTLID